MGCFSWLDCKTGEAVKIGDTAFLLIPKRFVKTYGERLKATYYEGYGEFDGEDVFELVAKFNTKVKEEGEELRCIGIDLAIEDEDNRKLKYPIKITKDPNAIYEDCNASLSDPLQGCN